MAFWKRSSECVQEGNPNFVSMELCELEYFNGREKTWSLSSIVKGSGRLYGGDVFGRCGEDSVVVLWDKDQGEYAEPMRAMSWRIRSGNSLQLNLRIGLGKLLVSSAALLMSWDYFGDCLRLLTVRNEIGRGTRKLARDGMDQFVKHRRCEFKEERSI
ncbi:hypothetical protein COLO4_19729 [Corchorus olitorius]|uniref:Uncharacterized protein n=1 Tax=Corchorus olitorius TaxID=93759 RepID=A0A1R3J3U8_9ROSI|nr:hypothetical protein COLO4_19729 [Corchorus olitorius]